MAIELPLNLTVLYTSVMLTMTVAVTLTFDRFVESCCFQNTAKTLHCKKCDLEQVHSFLASSNITRIYMRSSQLVQLNLDLLTPNINYFSCIDCDLTSITCTDGFDSAQRGAPTTHKHLHYLSLSHNRLKQVEGTLFQQLVSLRALDLSHNRLATLENTPLAASSLRRLNLSYNRLVAIPAHALASLPNLNALFLSHNRLVRFGKGWLAASRNLTTIDLTNNRLSRLTSVVNDDSWSHLTMKHLKLSANPLAVEHWNVFSEMSYIGTLTLDQVMVPHILPSGAFRNVTIRQIKLRKIETLTAVMNRAIVNLPILQGLEITDCRQLVFLDSDWLSDVPKLTSVILRNNALITLHSYIAATLPRNALSVNQVNTINILDLSNNPLRCDCTLNWLNTMTSSNGIHLLATNTCMAANRTSSSRFLVEQEQCKPSTIHLNAAHSTVALGKSLRLPCPTSGLPRPQIKFILPHGRSLSSGECYRGACIDIRHPWLLTIHHMAGRESGKYKCQALNSRGISERSFEVTVRQPRVRLIPVSVAATFITLTWRISGASVHSFFLSKKMLKSSYESLPRKESNDSNNRSYHVTNLALQTHSFTFGQLTAATWYRFELAVRPDVNISWSLAHLLLRTRTHGFRQHQGRFINYYVVMGATLPLLIVGALCCLCVSRLYRWRRYYDNRTIRQLAREGLLPNSASGHSDLAFLSANVGWHETTCHYEEQEDPDEHEEEDVLLDRSASRVGRWSGARLNRVRTGRSLLSPG